jgi:uncharacterized delta-60 repeat protein
MSDLDTTTFNSPFGFVTNGFNFIPPNQSYARAIALQTDGKIVMAGNTLDYPTIPSVNSYVAVCRYNTNGTLDNSFGTSGLATFLIQTTTLVVGPSITTNSLAIQSNGSIVVCGYILDNTGVFFQAFAVRFTSIGNLDTTFAGVGYIFITPSMFTTSYPSNAFTECYAESVQIDTSVGPNKIVIGGYARGVIPPSPTPTFFFILVRLDLNGVLDTSFGINGLVAQNFTGLDEFGFSLEIGSGNYFLAGRQGITTPSYRFIVAKFDNGGNPVLGFGSLGVTVIPAFLSLTVQEARSMLVQPDGKIVLAGTSITTAPFPASQVLSYALARLDGNNGTLDTSFGTGGTVITSVINLNLNGYSVAIQTDGKIVLGGGYFNTATSLNASFSLARYNVNGSLDLTFGINGNGLILEDIVPGTILPGSMQEVGYSVAIQTDGKILVGGSMGEFSDISGDVEFILARYLSVQTPPSPIPTAIVPICFPAGTPVTTDQGNIPIELINPEINTIMNKKIIAITQTITFDNNIVCFEKNALGYNMPNKKTHISKYHCIKWNDKLIEAYKFVGRLRGVHYEKYNGELLYNILMEKHYIIKINNMNVETLNPKNVVAHLYTNNYTYEERKNIILKMNEETKKNANSMNNDIIKLRNIQYSKRKLPHNRLTNNYFIAKFNNRTIRNYPLLQNVLQKEKQNSNAYKHTITKINYVGKTNKRFRR